MKRPAFGLMACACICVPVAGCYRQVPVESDGAAVRDGTEQTGEQQSVRLAFDWRPGLRLAAETRREVRQNDTLQSEDSSQFEMSVQKLGSSASNRGELAVTFTRGSRGDDGAVRQNGPIGELQVNSDGRLLSVDSGPKAAGQSGRKKRDAIEFQTRRWWQSSVALWSGETLAVGDSVVSQTEGNVRMPPVGRERIGVEVTIGFEGSVPCSLETGDCAVLTLERRPDVQELSELLQNWIDARAKRLATERRMTEQPDLTVTNVYANYKIRLVTDPATLIPRKMESTRLVRMRLEGRPADQPDGPPMTQAWKYHERETTHFRVISGARGE